MKEHKYFIGIIVFIALIFIVGVIVFAPEETESGNIEHPPERKTVLIKYQYLD